MLSRIKELVSGNELKELAGQLRQASVDAEKLRLMKQIDTLEMLIAKMRRQNAR